MGKKRKTKKERQQIFESRVVPKEINSKIPRPKSAEVQNHSIREVPRNIRYTASRRHVQQPEEKPVILKKRTHTARLLVPLVPKDATLVQFKEKEKKPRHAHSKPKKILDIFNFGNIRSKAAPSREPRKTKYTWSTRWDKTNEHANSGSSSIQQTKYQAF